MTRDGLTNGEGRDDVGAGFLADRSDGGEDQVLSVQPSPISRCVAHLRAEIPRIIANWVLRVANQPAFRAMPEIGLSEVQGAMPGVLSATLGALLVPDPGVDPEPRARVAAAAAHHGAARGRGGFPLRVVLAEYQELRSELWAITRRWADDEGSQDIPEEFLSRLVREFDVALIAAADAWLDATPRQARPGATT